MKTISETGFANPMILLDEIEKAGLSSLGDPLSALLPLLQRDTARQYRCPYLDANVDLSRVSWVMLGNGFGRLPAPVRDRVTIFQVGGPTGSQIRGLVERVLGETAAGAEIIEHVTAAINSRKMSPRGLHRLAAEFREIDNQPILN
ncbi:hypothetical protein D2T31_20270 [Sinirhodobacter populi]|uniref:AAA family ATPase n=1 Tax=Paenirhodobacter populi TaxID=2306993 RepID=A0A443K0R5_9RHOB|nr:hypothetical protein [Sinirhodobacter populi]RWR26362.1 hypothetical protein D2T31_20270 [Sinirhodobacter populi]